MSIAERLIRDGDASLDVKGRISRRAKDMFPIIIAIPYEYCVEMLGFVVECEG